MSILIVGSRGNMGKRYAAVLDHLDRKSMGVDVGDSPRRIQDLARNCDGVIIATPTDTHCELIKLLVALKKPILCEKPITKNLADLESTLDMCQALDTPLTMVYQYRHILRLKGPQTPGWTYYNYFRHGPDGLAWDCLQVIGLSKGEVTLEENSPIWRCRINDISLDIGEMDAAYVDMIRQWLRYPRAMEASVIREAHEKTANVARRYLNVV